MSIEIWQNFIQSMQGINSWATSISRNTGNDYGTTGGRYQGFRIEVKICAQLGHRVFELRSTEQLDFIRLQN